VRKLPDRSPLDGPSSTHRWYCPKGRLLELEPGKPLLQLTCTACFRNFVHDLIIGEWYAALPRVFDFERLDELTDLWLEEECLGRPSNGNS
jgi:hypothetical protein